MMGTTVEDRFSIGCQLFQSGNHFSAERVLREAIALAPTHYNACAVLALSLCLLEKYEDALTAADIALGIRPGVDGFRAQALALINLRRPHEAVPMAREAVALAPANGLAAFTLSVRSPGYKAHSSPLRRKNTISVPPSLTPGNIMLRAEYGRFLIRQRQIDKGEAIVAEIDQDVEINSVVLLRGEVALWRGRPDEAREFAVWVLSRNARSRPALRLLTLATANRKPLLAVWWRFTSIVKARPIWARILLMVLVFGIGMMFGGLPLFFFSCICGSRRRRSTAWFKTN